MGWRNDMLGPGKKRWLTPAMNTPARHCHCQECAMSLFIKGKKWSGQSITFKARTLSRIDRIFILKALLYLEVLEQCRLSLFRLYIH